MLATDQRWRSPASSVFRTCIAHATVSSANSAISFAFSARILRSAYAVEWVSHLRPPPGRGNGETDKRQDAQTNFAARARHDRLRDFSGSSGSASVVRGAQGSAEPVRGIGNRLHGVVIRY